MPGVLGKLRLAFLGLAFRVLDRIVPVRNDLWCFGAWAGYPHTLDNPRAVFEAVRNDPSIETVVLTWDRIPQANRVPGDLRLVAADSLRGAYYLARSRVVVLGVRLRGMAPFAPALRPSRHAVIQVWHGIPLKRIGRLFPEESVWMTETHKYAATVCSSETDQATMVRAFAPLTSDRVWITGLPRNDFILGPERDLPTDYSEQLQRLRELVGGRRLILFAPTWRKKSAKRFSFSDEDRQRLDAILEKHDAVLGLRGHPIGRGTGDPSADPARVNVLDLDGFPDVNVILREAEVLVTDYSSVFIDFLLLDRPIIHFAYDLEHYVKERGFIYDPAEAFGGPNASTAKELEELLDEALSSEEAFTEFRMKGRDLFHTHPGTGAGRRVADNIKALVSGALS